MPRDEHALLRAVGTMLAESDAATAQAIEAVREEVAAQLAALPEPEPGPPGRNGVDGRDGVDRVLALPATVGPDQRCPPGEIIHHARGIWQAVRPTSGDPSRDPLGWRCLVPGIAGIEFAENMATRQATCTIRTSDGEAHEVSWRLPAGYLPPDWQQRGWGILAGDILRDGDDDYVALIDFPGNPLGESTAANWQKMQVVGRRGKTGSAGQAGPQGEPGPGLRGLTIVRDPANAGLAILPDYDDPRVQAEPIAIDLMTEPAAQGRSAIVGFAGAYHAAKRFNRGDVVSAIVEGLPSLWLSLKPDNREPLRENTGGWQRMI